MKIKLTKQISPKQFEWRNDSRIFDWTRQNGLLAFNDHIQWLENHPKDKSIQMFGILIEDHVGVSDLMTEANVGTCGLTSISPLHGTAEFSLLIGPEYQQRGYGKAALIELLKYGFKHLRLNCIWGETFEGNPALNLFKSLGMQEEGKARQRYFKNGEFKDSYFVSILEKEARAQSWWA